MKSYLNAIPYAIFCDYYSVESCGLFSAQILMSDLSDYPDRYDTIYVEYWGA